MKNSTSNALNRRRALIRGAAVCAKTKPLEKEPDEGRSDRLELTQNHNDLLKTQLIEDKLEGILRAKWHGGVPEEASEVAL